jgi:hypothetical protein
MAANAYSNLRVGYVCLAALLLMFKEAYKLDFSVTYLKAIVYLVCSVISNDYYDNPWRNSYPGSNL